MVPNKAIIAARALLLATGFAVAQVSVAQVQTINVRTVSELHSAVSTANNNGGNTVIAVADGTYTLNDTLYVNVPNVTITSQSGNRANVVIQGDAMSSTARVGSLIRAAASNFQLRGVTLQRSKYHLIQVVGEQNADGLVVSNAILRDAYEQMIKASVDVNNLSVASDNGVIENSLFEYSAGIGPQYYIGGIDAHGSKNWTVRGNTFKGIASPSNSVAEFAVHFWDASGNNTVERNTIINCDRGIGFGMDGRGNSGGVIRNNMIYHAANNHQYADTAIALIESPDTRVYNNTIFLENNFPWSIEYRFGTTRNVQIVNNLSNKPVMARDGASGTAASNVSNAASSYFVNAAAGDLHLARSISGVVDAGQTVSGLTNDVDGQSRPAGAGIDIGADEYAASAAVTPNPPTNVRAE